MRSKLSLIGVPIVMIIGYFISLSFEWLFPVLTFGAAGLYLFIFAPVNKFIRYIFLFIFVINLLASAALYFGI
ncbi:DUF5970 family protein [Bacillus amyloliquefaciens]|uniref:DUF5970 family protein n=1 Tax=Bacillus amyloliquefaciens TaxID=1390 RepID=UPI003A853076